MITADYSEDRAFPGTKRNCLAFIWDNDEENHKTLPYLNISYWDKLNQWEQVSACLSSIVGWDEYIKNNNIIILKDGDTVLSSFDLSKISYNEILLIMTILRFMEEYPPSLRIAILIKEKFPGYPFLSCLVLVHSFKEVSMYYTNCCGSHGFRGFRYDATYRGGIPLPVSRISDVLEPNLGKSGYTDCVHRKVSPFLTEGKLKSDFKDEESLITYLEPLLEEYK